VDGSGLPDEVAGRVRRYDLLAVYSGDQTHVVFRVKARASPDEEIGRVKVSATEPVLVTEMRLLRIPSGARFEAVTLDEAARATVVDRVSVFLRPPQYALYRAPRLGGATQSTMTWV
jgi:hypothetical protein